MTASFMGEVALDASAVIALIWDEPGGDVVEAQIEGAAISAVNLAEVADYLVRKGGSRDRIERAIRRLPMEVMEADFDLALDASMLLPLTRQSGLSLGDRFCLALAKRLDRTALTSDRAWSRIADAIGVRIELIR